MPANTFSIQQVTQTVYLDKRGQVVNGFKLLVDIPEFNELVEINVPDTDPKTAQAAIRKYIENRRGLADLTD